MLLYLIRHGQTRAEAENLSEKDSGLSKTGLEQAKRLSLFFKGKRIDYVYCSKLKRAEETLKEILPHLGNVKTEYTEKINERSIGKYDREEYKKALEKSKLKDHQFRPPEGENYFDVEKRAQEFLYYLIKKHKNNNVMVVGHGIFFRLMILRMFKLHMKEMAYFDLRNGGISTFRIKKDKVLEFSLDESNHLLKNSSYERETIKIV